MYWRYETPFGEFRIVPRDYRYHVEWEGEDLGNCAEPLQALEDLVGGHCSMPSSGLDTAVCGLPDELSEWEQVDFPT